MQILKHETAVNDDDHSAGPLPSHTYTPTHVHIMYLAHTHAHMNIHTRVQVGAHMHTRGPGCLYARPALLPGSSLYVYSSSLGKYTHCQVLWGEAPNKYTKQEEPPPFLLLAPFCIPKQKPWSERVPGGTACDVDPQDPPQGRDRFLTLPGGKEPSHQGSGQWCPDGGAPPSSQHSESVVVTNGEGRGVSPPLPLTPFNPYLLPPELMCVL